MRKHSPPQLGTFAMHLSDYKKVDGIMLPHKIDTSLDGEPNEEWTIEKYKVNPQIKADTGRRRRSSDRQSTVRQSAVVSCSGIGRPDRIPV